jgi:hypothetical protein
MKKKIKTTFIDTAGHGYLSVSKKDFLRAGGDPKKITTFSGHTYTRLYLEEDCDASYFVETAKANGFEVELKDSYNPKFKITHNYKADLFDFEPKEGLIVTLNDHANYQITNIRPNGNLIVTHTVSRMKYRIGKHNPFEYINSWSNQLTV